MIPAISFAEDGPRTFEEAELSFVALLLRRAKVRVRVPIEEDEKGIFFLAAGRYYRANWDELEGLHAAGLHWDDIPVALHVARHAGVSSAEVARRRQAGESWRQIMDGLGVDPVSLHLAVTNPGRLARSGPYRHYHRAARQAWKPLELNDADIAKLANVKFISEYYRYPPEQVIALLSNGWSPLSIHRESAGPVPVEGKHRKARRSKRG